jgi:hypothetical protein
LNPKIASLESSMRRTLQSAREITDLVKSEKRAMTEDEAQDVQDMLDNVERMKAERQSLTEADREAKSIRSKTGRSIGWKSVATPFTKGARSWDGRLEAILGKGADVSDLEDRAIAREEGIRPLLEDTRRFHSLLPSSDPGTALHIESTKITARGLAAGSTYLPESGSDSVERDPMSTSAKAEADVAVAVEQVDLKQYALMSGYLPNAAFRSVEQLSPVMGAALGRELDIALDEAARAALEGAGASGPSAGSTVIEKLRYAKADLIANGVAGPFLAVISDVDAATIDLTPAVDMPSQFPFGLTITALPGIAAGEGFVLSREAMHEYKGSARLDSDPFSKFDTNETQLRLEFEALVEVRESSAIIDLSAGS